MYNFIKKSDQRGYTLLFAVFTSALVLGVGAFIVGIARKQFIISSAARDSVYAFYSADSGIECVVQAGASNWGPNNNPTSIDCAGSNIDLSAPVEIVNNSPDEDQPPKEGKVFATNGANKIFMTTGEFLLKQVGTENVQGCVTLKIWTGNDKTDNTITRSVISSRGYNVCDETGGPAASTRTVERAILLVQ